ncbi:MAG: GNAT family N-acetyltransferase [Bacteroidales bacterium]|nr:GNAT family N-acetyltransferase [Bacteroidales bacterium]MBP5518781.1 GNAT family N-acetyltransferase [Bacteroidales bacterium]
MKIDVIVADESHYKYAQPIIDLMNSSSKEKGTVIAVRSADYIIDKMANHKAVIALAEGGELAGFSYIETWSHTKFVANSGLIVAPKYRGEGLARQIKQRIFALSREMYPYAKIFSITTGLAVMKINSELGFRPVTLACLTDDKEFWEGCKGCQYYDFLQNNNYKICLCTALLYDPKEHIAENKLNKS